jgi:hypothetical protein
MWGRFILTLAIPLMWATGARAASYSGCLAVFRGTIIRTTFGGSLGSSNNIPPSCVHSMSAFSRLTIGLLEGSQGGVCSCGSVRTAIATAPIDPALISKGASGGTPLRGSKCNASDSTSGRANWFTFQPAPRSPRTPINWMAKPYASLSSFVYTISADSLGLFARRRGQND